MNNFLVLNTNGNGSSLPTTWGVTESATAPDPGTGDGELGGGFVQRDSERSQVTEGPQILRMGYDQGVSGDRSQNGTPHARGMALAREDSLEVESQRGGVPRDRRIGETTGLTTLRETTRSKKNTKAAIRIGSLNIRGYRNAGSPRSETKWNHINQLMRDRKIGILLVQETHLSEERRKDIENLFGRRLKIFNSADPENPTGKGGVAIVLNKSITNVDNTRTREIIPGRALMITTKWHREESITILAIYAPNVSPENGRESKAFWESLEDFFRRNPRVRIDILAGDFNVTEDAIDRLPMRQDPEEAVEALDGLKMRLRLKDEWRDAHTTTKTYTFMQSASSTMARLDRIYLRDGYEGSARDWKTEPSGIPGTDHLLVSVLLAHRNAPVVGRGRWTLKNHILKDEVFRNIVNKKGREALAQVRNMTRSDVINPQSVYKEWKKEVLEAAKGRERAKVPKYEKDKKDLEDAMKQCHTDPDMDELTKRNKIKDIMEKLDKLVTKNHMEVRERIATRNRLEGETVCKYWTSSNKIAKPRDMILALKKPTEGNHGEGNAVLEHHSAKMAEIARNYHNELQDLRKESDERTREESTQKVLNSLRTSTTDEQNEKLGALVSLEELRSALKLSKNDSAPGIDGLTYEFWKSFNDQYINDARLAENGNRGDRSFDILDLLRRVYIDIQTFGTIEDSDFAEGWMCPLYKKNDRSDIANYRPITCLNTDYKLFTKVLAERLAEVIPRLIHPSQAGFIPGRSIAEQTKLIRMMIHYAEATEENGIIVALDQEKAYDKIDHDYLWRTLGAFNLPETFVSMVKALYSKAETRIMINGHLSSPWKVTRGVRQGDPLSCLLFDLAIEPLAASLRASNLKGYMIPGHPEKLIANLFADDTTIFLSCEDDYEELENILETWCIAAGAKFNSTKTEIIPMGSEMFRRGVINERIMRPGGPILPPGIHIAEDGVATRILGAWFGNKVEEGSPWSNIVEKIDRSLKNWDKSNPTIEGRRHIAQMVVAGMSQYLTQVQGMPGHIERMLAKRVRNFMWADKSPLVNEQTLFRKLSEGGRSLVDIKTRNKAIDVMWLKSYLNFGPNRPTWALVADAIMALNVPVGEEGVDKRIRLNPFLQTWKTRTSSRGEICRDISRLFKTAKEFGVRLEGIAMSEEIILSMPIWYHAKADPKLRRMNGGRTSECLKAKHGVRTVRDAYKLASTIHDGTHIDYPECECPSCMLIENETGCMHPSWCIKKSDEMLSMLPEKWNPKSTLREVAGPAEEDPDGNRRYFNPDLRTPGPLANAFRIFTMGQTCESLYAPPPLIHMENVVEAVIAGSKRKGTGRRVEEKVGAGVVFPGKERDDSSALWINIAENTNTTALLVAVLVTSMKVGIRTPLQIRIKSKQIMDLLTERVTTIEDTDFLGIKDGALLKNVLGRLRMHRASIALQDTSKDSERSEDRSAKNRADEALGGERVWVPPPVPAELYQTGAKLATMTQAQAYTRIRGLILPRDRPRTMKMIRGVKKRAKDLFGKTPDAPLVWKSLRSKDFSKKIQVFLWKMMHDAYKVGRYWRTASMSQDLLERSRCKHDGKLDTMGHILTRCVCPGQATVWGLVRDLWKKSTGEDLPEIKVNLILGSAIPQGHLNEEEAGRSRLRKILLVESAHLIWTLRCERVIRNDDAPHCEREITQRWIKLVRDRAAMDQRLSNPKLTSILRL